MTAEPPPALALAPDRDTFALFGRPALPAIEELARPELRLAGVRIDPATSGPAAPAYYHSIELGRVAGGARRAVPLPADARITEARWSPDGSRLAFVNTTAAALQLWVVDVETATARPLTDAALNGTLGSPFQWAPDGRSLVVKLVPRDRGSAPEAPRVPTGPVVQENIGKAAPARTYQDLLRGPHDEALFEHYFAARLARVHLDSGEIQPLGEPAIISDFSPAPGGEYLLVERVKRPFSYLVPYYRFPTEVTIVGNDGTPIRLVAELPLAEDVPVAFDAVPVGPRSIQWRADAPATLSWVEALDGGDPRREASERDRVFVLPAPFASEPEPLLTLEHRYAGVQWGRDDFALVYSRWWNTRNERRYAVRPGSPGSEPRLLTDRSYQDRYGDPGTPVTVRNAAGRAVLLFSADGGSIFLAGDGASPRGDYPFLDRMELNSRESARLWRAADPHYEQVAAVLDPAGPAVITRRESRTEPPNYCVRDLATGAARALTDFPDPAPELAGIGREIITYERADGVKLSATLFTPAGIQRGARRSAPHAGVGLPARVPRPRRRRADR